MASPIGSLETQDEELGHWRALRQAAKGEYKKILNERENALLEANARFGPRSSKFQTARADLEEAKLQRDDIYGVIRRPLNRHDVRWGYLAGFFVLLALLQASVNKFLFDVALQSFGIFSYLTSFVLAVLLLIIAHAAGKSLRQIWSEYRRKIVWQSVAVVVISLIVLFCVVSVLTIGRAMTSANAGIASFQEMFTAVATTVTQQGFWRTLASAFGDISALVLATVNGAGIFAAIMLAFFTHDPDKDFDIAATRVDKYRAVLARLDDSYTKGKTRVVHRYAPDITATSTRYKTVNKQVMELKHSLGQAIDADDEFLIDDWDQLAETSEVGDSQAPQPSRPAAPNESSGGRVPHLTPVESAPPEQRRA